MASARAAIPAAPFGNAEEEHQELPPLHHEVHYIYTLAAFWALTRVCSRVSATANLAHLLQDR